jgi:hypothetical protein
LQNLLRRFLCVGLFLPPNEMLRPPSAGPDL